MTITKAFSMSKACPRRAAPIRASPIHGRANPAFPTNPIRLACWKYAPVSPTMISERKIMAKMLKFPHPPLPMPPRGTTGKDASRQCKKNNPEFVDCVFFIPHSSSHEGAVCVAAVQNEIQDNGRWSPSSEVRPVLQNEVVAAEARETRGKYSDLKNTKTKTKTSNAAINDAAYQITIATQAIARQASQFMGKLSGSATEPPPWTTQLFMPAIVTSAHLFVCDYSPDDVAPQTDTGCDGECHGQTSPSSGSRAGSGPPGTLDVPKWSGLKYQIMPLSAPTTTSHAPSPSQSTTAGWTP